MDVGFPWLNRFSSDEVDMRVWGLSLLSSDQVDAVVLWVKPIVI